MLAALRDWPMLIEFDSDAESEYAKALAWYANQSQRSAVRFEDGVQKGIVEVSATPERFPLIYRDCRAYSLRPFPYSLIYRQVGNRIRILAVAHWKREPSYWWHRT